MKIKKVYKKSIFEGFAVLLKNEYKDDTYIKMTDDRLNEEMTELLSQKAELLCLKDKGKIIGYCVYRDIHDKQVSISDFFIREEFRGKGYGKKFLSMVEEYLKNLGLSFVCLASRPGKEGFYYSCGYSGEGLLQVDMDKASKQEIESFLIERNIKVAAYKVWNNKVHQFWFDAKNIMDNPQFLVNCDKYGYSAQVVFSKALSKNNNTLVD